MSSPTASGNPFDDMHNVTKSPFWFFTKTEKPDCKIREEEIEWIYKLFQWIRLNSDETKKSREKRKEPRHTIFCFRFFIELGKDRYCSHKIDKGIGHEDDHGDGDSTDSKWEDLIGVGKYRPENEGKYRDSEVDSLDPIHTCVSVVKRHDEDNQLIDRICEWCYDRTHRSEFICGDEDTDCRHLIEKPSDDIWLGFPDHDRLHISKWWYKDEYRRYPCCEFVEGDGLREEVHSFLFIVSDENKKHKKTTHFWWKFENRRRFNIVHCIV